MAPGNIAQDETLPAVAYHVISGQHEGELGGIDLAGEVRLQFDAHADTQLAAEAVTAAILAAARTLCAACPTTIGDGSPVCDVEVFGPRDLSEHLADGSDEWRFVSSVDLLLYTH
jgi:hypothetical protein